MKKFCAILCFILCLTINVSALECEYGIAPQFDSVQDFKNGVALVHKDGQSAVIDRYGKVIVDYDSRLKHIRSNGLIMVVGENDLAAFFSSKGVQLTDYVYDTYPVTDPKWKEKRYYFTTSLRDGDGKSDLVPFSRNKKYGYINSSGVEVVPPTFGYADGFYNGIAPISDEGTLYEYGTYQGGKYGLINDEGKVLIPSNSYWLASYSAECGYSFVTNGGAKILADTEGNVAEANSMGYAGINSDYFDIYDGEGRTGFADANGNIIIPLGFYARLHRINDDFFIVDNTIVNNRNEIVYSAPEGVMVYLHYTSSTGRSNFARILKPAADGVPGHNLVGLVNTNGVVILDAIYESAYDMGEGLIYAQDTNQNYLFDYFGNLLCILDGNLCGPSRDGLFTINDFDTNEAGFMLNPLLHPKVFVDDKRLESDVYPKIENDRTLVPMRAVFESLNAEVFWDEQSYTVTAKKGDTTISLAIGSNTLYKNGEEIYVDVPAKIENDRTLVPLRVVSESLNCRVDWDGENRIVNIVTK